MSAHTPGPWVPFVCDRPLSEMPDYLKEAIDASGGTEFRMVAAFDELGQCDVCMVGNGPRGHANARLIAAAPEMLAALKWAARFINAEAHDPQLMEMVDAAIAKAEGRAE